MLTSGRCWLKKIKKTLAQKASNNKLLISKHHFYGVKAPQEDQIPHLKAP